MDGNTLLNPLDTFSIELPNTSQMIAVASNTYEFKDNLSLLRHIYQFLNDFRA